MENQLSTEEIRAFCIGNLELLDKMYVICNSENEAAFEKFINRKKSIAEDFFVKIRYAASCVLKGVMVAVGLGHYVDFETYQDYKKNRNIKTSMDVLMEHIIYIKDTSLKMPIAIQNTISAIERDDDTLMRYYKEIVKHLSSQNIIQPHIRAILACGVDVPFEQGHFQRMFEVHENTVTDDVGDTDYVTQIKRSFAVHRRRIAGVQN